MKGNQNTENIEPELLQILVCPADKNKLEYNSGENTLFCLKCAKKYEIKNGIPILLTD